jgi:hypothetical protein
MTALHPDVLTAAEAVAYLRLDAVAPTEQSALGTLARLTRQGHLHPLRWAKEHLYAKPDLDAFVARSIAALAGASDTVTEGEPPQDHDEPQLSANGHHGGAPNER